MPKSVNSTLPTITSVSDLLRSLKKWQSQLNPLLKVTKTPHAPWNFAATRQRGGILLSWAPMAVGDADGYQILRSDNGDFTSPVIIGVPNVRQSSYFDSIAGTTGGTGPVTKWYRIRATNGTPSQSQSIFGVLSGIVSTSNIDSTDTATAASTTYDVTTSDTTQRSAQRGRIILNFPRVD